MNIARLVLGVLPIAFIISAQAPVRARPAAAAYACATYGYTMSVPAGWRATHPDTGACAVKDPQGMAGTLENSSPTFASPGAKVAPQGTSNGGTLDIQSGAAIGMSVGGKKADFPALAAFVLTFMGVPTSRIVASTVTVHGVPFTVFKQTVSIKDDKGKVHHLYILLAGAKHRSYSYGYAGFVVQDRNPLGAQQILQVNAAFQSIILR